MSGLLVKDFKLLWNQKNFFAIILVVGMVMMVTGNNPLFIVSYCTMVCSFFSISTISYDEYGNGYPFLFTLPVSRKVYAVEKYLFALILNIVVGGVTIIASAIYLSVKEPKTDLILWVITAVVTVAALYVLLLVMIPLQLKFGAEKGRIAMFAVMICVFVIIWAGERVREHLQLQADWANQLPVALWELIAVVIFAVAVAVSLWCSIRIVEKKQF